MFKLVFVVDISFSSMGEEKCPKRQTVMHFPILKVTTKDLTKRCSGKRKRLRILW